jgi:hypothetical protein
MAFRRKNLDLKKLEKKEKGEKTPLKQTHTKSFDNNALTTS